MSDAPTGAPPGRPTEDPGRTYRARLPYAKAKGEAKPHARRVIGEPSDCRRLVVSRMRSGYASAEPGRVLMARNDAAEESSNLLERLGDHLAIVLTLFGVAAFGVLRLSFAAFYRHFGVTPEDVGYDYATVLTVALPGVVAILVVVAVLVYGLVALLFSSEKEESDDAAQRPSAPVEALRCCSSLSSASYSPSWPSC